MVLFFDGVSSRLINATTLQQVHGTASNMSHKELRFSLATLKKLKQSFPSGPQSNALKVGYIYSRDK